jgi:hypothetical protein
VQERQRTAIEAETVQRQLRDVVDVRLVVDEEDFPGSELGRDWGQEDMAFPLRKWRHERAMKEDFSYNSCRKNHCSTRPTH